MWFICTQEALFSYLADVFFSFWNIFLTRNTIVAELKSSVTLYDVCVPLLKDLKSFINSQALQQVNSKGTHF